VLRWSLVSLLCWRSGRRGLSSVRSPFVIESEIPRPPASFLFNEIRALDFYNQLNTSIGLETDYPGSHTVWLSDDQALDYNALLDIYNSTHNDDALKMAQNINSSISQWGGFYRYWNPVFEVIGHYPNSTQVMCGTSQTIGESEGYTINATVFNQCPGFQYWLFADQLAYRVLLDLHSQNYTLAESDFTKLNITWDGSGFADQAFNGTYQSFKLATFLIAWKALNQTTNTGPFAAGYLLTVGSVTAIMSQLQSNDGGVWTGYRVSDRQLEYGPTISLENGETTSLFILALSFPTSPSPVQESPFDWFAVAAFVVAIIVMILLVLRRVKAGRLGPVP
jgi:hypothetical protein